MRIAIDAREALRAKRTGKGQWTAGFLRELASRSGIDVVPVVDDSVSDAPSNAVRIPGHGLLWHLRVAKWLKSRPVDLYVASTSYLVPAIAGGAVPCMPVVHDLIAFRGEPHDVRATFIERLTLGRAVKRTAQVLTISDATRDDLLERYPSLDPAKVVTVYAGPDLATPPLSASDGRTILCIGTLCPRKNQLGLINAFAALPSDIRAKHRLLLVGGRGWGDDEIVRLAQSTQGVEWKGYVDQYEYERVLSSCHVFAFPSFYEGFGLSVLDALARGVPVLTSDRGSLKEVAGDAALMVNPDGIETITAGLVRLLTEPVLREELHKKGPTQAATFSWKRTVDLFLAAVSPKNSV